MIDQYSCTCVRRGRKLFQNGFQVIDPFEQFDHNPYICQVITPHVLDQVSIVAPFDPDS